MINDPMVERLAIQIRWEEHITENDTDHWFQPCTPQDCWNLMTPAVKNLYRYKAMYQLTGDPMWLKKSPQEGLPPDWIEAHGKLLAEHYPEGPNKPYKP